MAVEEVGVKLLAENASKFDKEMRESRAAFDSFVDALNAGTRGIDSSMDKSEKSITDFTSSTEDNFNRIDAASEIVIGALRRVGEIAVNAFLAAGEAAIGFGIDSVNVAGDFEATVNRFSAVTGGSLAAAGMDVEDFSDLFLEMGAVTQYSAQEAAEAAVNLAKGGIEPAAIAAGGLEAALSLAAAGELDLATSAEILAKQLGVWADKGVTAIQITDLLAQAANASTVDVDELANGLANVQGRAAGMGVEYEDLVQTMALIAPSFESASTAGTSLNNFLARLIPSTEKAEDAMKDLGLATSDGSSLFFDATGSFIGMEAATALLSTATAGLSEEEKSKAFNIIFGNDAMGAAIALSNANAEGYNAMGVAMGAAGTAADQAALRNQGYNFALEEMRGSMETLQIVIGTALLPVLTELIQNHITPGINKFLEFSQAIQSSQDPIGALIAKIDEIVPGFKSFLDTIANIPTRIAEISTAFQEDFAPEIQLAKDIFETAMIVIESITNSVFGTVTDAIADFKFSMMDGFSNSGATLEAFGRLWEALEPIVMGILQALGAAFLFFLGVVTGIFTGILNAADPFLGGLVIVLDSISFALGGLAKFVEGFVNLIVSLFEGNAKGVWDALTAMETGVKEIFLGMAAAVLATIGTLIASGLAFIEGFVLGIIEFFVRLYNDLVGHSIIPDMVNGILKWFNDLAVRGLVFVMGLVDDIKALFTETDWGALGRGIVDGIINGITSLAGNLATAARDAASAAYTAVTDFLGMESPSKLFMEVGEMTMTGFIVGIEDGEAGAAATMESVFRGLTMDALEPVMSPAVSPPASPASNITNVYNDNSTHGGENYNMNVRTPESVGTVGNTIRALQSIGKIRGRG
jgi:TP901 family phage tail tape measure protein